MYPGFCVRAGYIIVNKVDMASAFMELVVFWGRQTMERVVAITHDEGYERESTESYRCT